ncbi:2-C-methyl-D-erythritol 4-phosphate cytidylyltransferase [Turicimonas sp. TL08]
MIKNQANNNLTAIVVAAGVGSRMGDKSPKQYKKIGTKTMLELSIDALLAEPRITRVIIVVSPSDMLAQSLNFDNDAVTVARVGGLTRASSVQNGLSYAAFTSNDWVLVHDAARPCLLPSDVSKLIDTCIENDKGGLLAVRVNDTLKKESDHGTASHTVPRDGLWAAQTPQMFKAFDLIDALEKAGESVTDEASAMEKNGCSPLLVEGTETNIKVTRPTDLWLAEAILDKRNKGLK